MKSELKRTQDALNLAIQELRRKGRHTSIQTCEQASEQALEEIEAVLNPPPKMEEVEETVGWVNIYPESVYIQSILQPSKKCADDQASPHRIDCVEVRRKVMRPKLAPKTHRVEVEIEWVSNGGNVIIPKGILHFGTGWGDLVGKKGRMTFEWEE